MIYMAIAFFIVGCAFFVQSYRVKYEIEKQKKVYEEELKKFAEHIISTSKVPFELIISLQEWVQRDFLMEVSAEFMMSHRLSDLVVTSRLSQNAIEKLSIEYFKIVKKTLDLKLNDLGENLTKETLDNARKVME